MKSEAGIETAKLTVPVGKRDHTQGPLTAPITLVEYGDYECPYCGAAYAVVKAIQKSLGKRLCFAFRNFPLTNMHPHAEHAAEAAEAAGAQDKFWEMHDCLYENQTALADTDLARYASQLGLDMPRFTKEIERGAHTRRILEDFRNGIRSGVNGTPSFFINSVRYDGEYEYETLLAALVDAGERGK
jgi:protein-disulfide isomerase